MNRRRALGSPVRQAWSVSVSSSARPNASPAHTASATRLTDIQGGYTRSGPKSCSGAGTFFDRKRGLLAEQLGKRPKRFGAGPLEPIENHGLHRGWNGSGPLAECNPDASILVAPRDHRVRWHHHAHPSSHEVTHRL